MKEKRPKKEPLDVKYILKTYWNFVKNYKFVALSLIIIALTLTFMNYGIRYLFKKVIDNAENFVTETISLSELMISIRIILIIWISIIIFSAILRWLRVHQINKLEIKIMSDLKEFYYNHIVQLSAKFHTTHKTGALIARLGRGTNAMDRVTEFFVFNVLSLVFELAITGITLFTIGYKIGLVVLATSTIFVIYSLHLQKLERKRRVETNVAEDHEKGFTSDTFTNIDSIKYYGKEQFIKNKYAQIREKTNKLTRNEWNIFRWMNSVEQLIIAGGGILVLILAIKGFVDAALTLGTITFVWTLHNSLIGNIEYFMNSLRGYNRAVADLHDLFQYGKIENEIKDKPNAPNLEVKEGKIEFQNVQFKYHENALFSKFNLEIPKNKKVALVGHSGSGKSTIVKLLYRLYDIEKGSIKIDGIDIKDVKQESLRSELSIVPQECVLFDDTIYNNILFSNPKASRAEVMKAIKFAQLDKVIANFPYKENTIVGERGVKLSGGEKQRVSIARAILANKKILVLDEATSSLDSKTEHEIQRDLQNLMQNRTSLIIAHRLSTIMNADIIVVLDKGKIVQQGTHNQLINKPGQYRELWNLQKGGYLGE